jgi:hypothetical protein
MARSLLFYGTGFFPCGRTLIRINKPTRAAMRIYDIEFDIDSFLDEMEEMQRARRQRQQQIHRGSELGTGDATEREGD